jgi:PTH1 family peptidyl-tRNA hydrolase|tara:strand:- start:3022 stop:3690 length:669 start_codon:yes stop_codon:yes gene_type:complete
VSSLLGLGTQPNPANSEEGGQAVLILSGQGNPGEKYAKNRHNAGFLVLDEIHAAHGFQPWRSKFESEIAEGFIGPGRIKTLLVKPQTFYNETGRALSKVAQFYKLSPEDIVVLHDEIDLAPGRVRLKQGGGHSGNNGVRSMIAHLGENVRRVRIGVGHPGDKSRVMPYVLSDFSRADHDWFDPLVRAISDALPFLADGDDERFQTEVMRLAPAPKHDPKQNR